MHRSYDRGSQVTPKLWVLSVEMNSWLPSGADNLEAALRFVQSCGTMAYTTALYKFTLIWRMKILVFLKTRPVGSVFFPSVSAVDPRTVLGTMFKRKISSPSRKGLLSIAQSVAKPLYRLRYQRSYTPCSYFLKRHIFKATNLISTYAYSRWLVVERRMVVTWKAFAFVFVICLAKQNKRASVCVSWR